jgi:hypothetical protein
MRGGKGGTCLRQPRLGLGDIGAGVLADLEAVAGGAQLLRHDADIGLAHVDHLQVAPDVEVGRDRIQQHLLFDRHEALPRGLHGLARSLDPQPAAVAGIEHPFGHEAGGARGRVGDEIAVGRRHEGQGRAQLRHGLRHALVIDAQKEPVLFEKRRADIGVRHRGPQGVGARDAGAAAAATAIPKAAMPRFSPTPNPVIPPP